VNLFTLSKCIAIASLFLIDFDSIEILSVVSAMFKSFFDRCLFFFFFLIVDLLLPDDLDRVNLRLDFAKNRRID